VFVCAHTRCVCSPAQPTPFSSAAALSCFYCCVLVSASETFLLLVCLPSCPPARPFACLLLYCPVQRRPPGDMEYCSRVGNRSPKLTRWEFSDDTV
jgi:hypothetical protein